MATRGDGRPTIGSILATIRRRLGMWKWEILEEARARNGTLRQRERWGLLGRPSVAHGMLSAAELAARLGLRRVTACEFGVATGDGLIYLVELAARIEAETGIAFRVVGFDTGRGLPAPTDYRDHPELWTAGDFAMDVPALRARLAGRAELVLGDIAETVPAWLETLTADEPIGFAAIDVDLYSGAAAALRAFEGSPDLYLPLVGLHMDDVIFPTANRWCGELAAVAEFNDRNDRRKIDRDRGIDLRPHGRPAQWAAHAWGLHVLDHPWRNRESRARPMGLGEHMHSYFR